MLEILTGLPSGIFSIPETERPVTVEIHSFHPVDFHRSFSPCPTPHSHNLCSFTHTAVSTREVNPSLPKMLLT